jgi:hypothetical protein
MNVPGFQAEASLYQSTLSYCTVAHHISNNLVLPQISVGDILGEIWCYGGCLWRYITCILTCRYDFECALCEAFLLECALVCRPTVFDGTA